MNAKRSVDISEMFAQGTPIDEAMNEAVRQVIELHRRAGLPLMVWRNDRVEEIDPEFAAALYTEEMKNANSPNLLTDESKGPVAGG